MVMPHAGTGTHDKGSRVSHFLTDDKSFLQISMSFKIEKMCSPKTDTTSPAISIDQSIATDSSSAKIGNRMMRRRLTFAPEISMETGTISREEYTDEEKKRCWWSVKEVSRSRKQCKQLILIGRERGQHCIKMIDDSFKAAQYLSTRSLGDKAVEALFQDPSNYTSKLEAWALNGQGRRGLERYISSFQMRQRSAKAREIREILLEAQRMGISSDEGAEIYKERSLESRIYARWMGYADHSSAYFL
jgi:predicted metalloprotease